MPLLEVVSLGAKAKVKVAFHTIVLAFSNLLSSYFTINNFFCLYRYRVDVERVLYICHASSAQSLEL